MHRIQCSLVRSLVRLVLPTKHCGKISARSLPMRVSNASGTGVFKNCGCQVITISLAHTAVWARQTYIWSPSTQYIYTLVTRFLFNWLIGQNIESPCVCVAVWHLFKIVTTFGHQLLSILMSTWFGHNSCCLPYIMSLATLYFRKECPST